MEKKIVIVLDCGATNVRAIAVNESGDIVAKSSYSNSISADPLYPEYSIWDIKEIWNKLLRATKDVVVKTGKKHIAGVTVTSFGVDGAPMLKSGKLLYPVISWACQRTAPIMESMDKYISINELYKINGLNKFSFNTINKLIWFKETRPETIEQMDHFVFISSIFLYFLTGEFVTDTTMAGTSMLTDIKTRRFSKEIFDSIGFDSHTFPPIVEPGEVIGKITKQASEVTGLPKGVPVVATGHDTQFAIFGSGAKKNQPVLSSGTWEILMVRTSEFNTDIEMYKKGITNEFDAVPGLYNPGVQWLGSGVIEWIQRMFYNCGQEKDEIYEIMIQEAESISKNNIWLDPGFLNEKGLISGLGINTKRANIYLAALEAMSRLLVESLKILEGQGSFVADSVICVGGGSKNRLWNQLRANALGIPVKTITRKETTVLGAALFVLSGIGVYSNPEEARNNVDYNQTSIEPNI